MLLNVPHFRQRQQTDCLVACTAMLLDYLQKPIPYRRISRILKTRDVGTPFSNVRNLEQRGYYIQIGVDSTIDFLVDRLDRGFPIIVDVATGELPHWQARTDISESEKQSRHAVVVVGAESGLVFVNDPDMDEAPIAIEAGYLDLAWLERDNRYALISLGSFDTLRK